MNNKKLIIEEISRMRSMMGLNENYVPTLLLEARDPAKLIDGLITFAKGADAAKGTLIRSMDAETKEFFNSRLAEYGDELFGAGSAIKSIDDLADAARLSELAAYSKKLASEFDNVKALIKSQGFDFSKYVFLPKFIQPTITDKNIKNLIKQLPDNSLLKNVLEKAKNKDFANILDDDIIALNQHLAALRQANINNGNMRKYLDGIINDFKTLTKDKSDWNVIENSKLGDNLDNNNVFVQNFKNKAGNDIEAKLDGNDATGDSIIVTNKSVDPPTETIYYRTLQEPLDQESVLYRFDEEGNIVLFKQGEEFKPDGWKDDNGVIVFTKDNIDYVTDKDSSSVVDGKGGADSWFTKTEIKKTEPENTTGRVSDEEERILDDVFSSADEVERNIDQISEDINVKIAKAEETAKKLYESNMFGFQTMVAEIRTKFDKSGDYLPTIEEIGIINFALKKGVIKNTDPILTKIQNSCLRTPAWNELYNLVGEYREYKAKLKTMNSTTSKVNKLTGQVTIEQNKVPSFSEYLKEKGFKSPSFVQNATVRGVKFGQDALETLMITVSGHVYRLNEGFVNMGPKKWFSSFMSVVAIGGLWSMQAFGILTDVYDQTVSGYYRLDFAQETLINKSVQEFFGYVKPIVYSGSIAFNLYENVKGNPNFQYRKNPPQCQWDVPGTNPDEYAIKLSTPLYIQGQEFEYFTIKISNDKLFPGSEKLSKQHSLVINDAEAVNSIVTNTTTTKGSLGEGTALNDNIKTAMKNTFGTEFPADAWTVIDGKFDSKTGDVETYSFTLTNNIGEKKSKTLQYDTKTKLFKK